MYSRDLVLGLIDNIYDAAGDPRQWPTFLNRFTDAMGSTSKTLSEALKDSGVGLDNYDLGRRLQNPTSNVRRITGNISCDRRPDDDLS